MFGINYFRGEPTDYLLVYRGRKLARKGAGLAFYYWRPSTSIVLIPTSTADTPFIFKETAGDFQAVTVQGHLTYRVVRPEATAAILNFSIDPRKKAYKSSDPDKLAQRIVDVVQVNTRSELLQLTLQDALRQSGSIAERVLARTKADSALAEMGVECAGLYFIAIQPTPEMAKALEAEFREALQVRADQAIYQRRALAVEQERRIKANELETELMLEQRRRELVDLQGENNLKQAEFDARSTEIRLAPFMAQDPARLLALGLRELGMNAEKIGNLTITPDLLARILDRPSGERGPAD
jgi:regulator of protease activity HflC (stomatin/prohibitin superfamily)